MNKNLNEKKDPQIHNPVPRHQDNTYKVHKFLRKTGRVGKYSVYSDASRKSMHSLTVSEVHEYALSCL